MAVHRIFPHSSLEQVAPGLWRVVGTLPFPLKRNMFVYRLGDGTLLLYSVVALDEAGLAALDALGRPSVMVVPHPFHIMDVPFYKARYPDLHVVGQPDAQARLDDPSKHWKFDVGDLDVRKRWKEYMAAYDAAIRATGTEWAPWTVVPANSKTHRNLMVGTLLVQRLRALKLRPPPPTEALSRLRIS